MKEDRPRDWWQTIPGILTGLAGITTATTSLVIALHQTGFLGGKDSTRGTSVSPTPSDDISSEEAPTIAASVSPGKIETTPSDPPTLPSGSVKLFISTSPEVQAVIDDSQGFTNVRSEPEVGDNVIARVLKGESFYTIPQETDWWPVRTKDDKLGYMHRSRIRLLK